MSLQVAKLNNVRIQNVPLISVFGIIESVIIFFYCSSIVITKGEYCYPPDGDLFKLSKQFSNW